MRRSAQSASDMPNRDHFRRWPPVPTTPSIIPISELTGRNYLGYDPMSLRTLRDSRTNFSSGRNAINSSTALLFTCG